MAKAPASPAKKKGGPNGTIMLIAVTPLALAFMSYTVVLLAGMVPTFIAYISDRERQKLTALTVGALNLAATVPVMLQLVEGGASMSAAMRLLSSPFNWTIMFAGAGLGWIFALVVPALIAGFVLARDKAKLGDIRTRQQQLVDEWGETVAK